MSNRKKAYVLIEILFALFIFCSMMLMIVKLELSSIKCKDIEEDYKRYNLFCEAIYKEILYNTNDTDMKAYEDSDYYIKDENISIDKIENMSVFELLSNEKGQGSYIQIRINNEGVYNVNLKIHYIKYGKEEIFNKDFKKGIY